MMEFDEIERVENGKGVLIPAKSTNDKFDDLRALILKDADSKPDKYRAHITLMHPRSSTCTDETFECIAAHKLPSMLYFDKISLIQQTNGGKWVVVEQF